MLALKGEPVSLIGLLQGQLLSLVTGHLSKLFSFLKWQDLKAILLLTSALLLSVNRCASNTVIA